MAMVLDEEELDDYDDFVKCRICLHVYDEEVRKPKFLPCSHTVCLPCVESISIHELPLYSELLVKLCPFCRSAFQPLDLPNNVYALQMLKEKDYRDSSLLASKILDVSERSLENMLKVHKEINDQLAKKMSLINHNEEKTQKLIDKNNSQIMSLMGLLKNPSLFPDNKFFSGNLLSKFILRLFKKGRLKGEIHIRPAPTFYPEFVRKLGDFCFRSPKEFCRSVDKAMAGVFVLFPMINPEFVPAVPSMTEQMDSWMQPANDMDEVGISLIKSLGDKITHWSFVFILEDKEDFQSHENLPKAVTENELFGHVIHHHMLEPLIRLSLSSKSDRSDYLMTLESH